MNISKIEKKMSDSYPQNFDKDGKLVSGQKADNSMDEVIDKINELVDVVNNIIDNKLLQGVADGN